MNIKDAAKILGGLYVVMAIIMFLLGFIITVVNAISMGSDTLSNPMVVILIFIIGPRLASLANDQNSYVNKLIIR